jgi:redox-sensitive bicupin YhaK (pirin superfamily)
MKTKHFKAADRGTKDLGWLKSNFNFSFGPYAQPDRTAFGLLSAFNDDFVAPGKGFGLHAHQNMEIISIMLQGKMNHKDNLGYTEVVEKDWVQIMSAGSGLRHEEYNVGEEEVNFLQIWIEPKLQNINPRYQRRYFPEAERKNKLTTVVSNEEGTAHCWINQNAKLSLGFYDAGQQFTYNFNPLNKAVYLFIMEGELDIQGETISKRNAIGIWDTDTLSINVLQDSKFILIEVPINA